MKTLTVLIPVYNTEKYIKRCLDSLLLEDQKEDLEVLVVSDGSKDHSVEIAKEYEQKYPEIFRVIEKENGGHGSTINRGLLEATGKYFRVLDSDDWFNITEFSKFLKLLKQQDSDLVVCDYRKEFVYESREDLFEYKSLEEGKQYQFDDFDLELLHGEYFVMATSTYKTEVLRRSKLQLLEKTFYVDMQYNIVPITEVQTFVYYKCDVYRYFIGRPDQSVNVSSFVRNQDHHKKMITWLIKYYTKKEKSLSPNKQKYISMIINYTLYTHYTIYCQYDEDKNRAYKEIVAFDRFLLRTNKELYDNLNCMSDVKLNRATNFIGVKRNNKVLNKLAVIGKRMKHRRG